VSKAKPNPARAGTAFANREGIGRFGMGMKTAALSMSPVLDV